MVNNSLDVFVNKKPTGSLSFEDYKYIFNYDNEATGLVSLTMPIRVESWKSRELHPIFQMNMPEGALKEAIHNHFAKLYTMNDLNLLKLIGPYMLGRVKFNILKENNDSLDLESILHNSKESLFEELMDKFAIRSGISGVQPKLLLSMHNKTTMKFEHYIIKSWQKDYPQLALNEYFCMRAIANAGLDTPEFYLSDNLSMFIMKRFDVRDDNSYLGFEDMCVLSARGTDEKYNGSYEEVIRIIKDVVAPQYRKSAIRTFFTAIIMNHLLQNGDGHLKNYGVLYEHDYQDARLAPIYDVITTTVYIKNDIPALKLSDEKVWFKEKTYHSFAKKSCNISQKEYEEILQTCYQSIQTTKKEIDTYAKENPDTFTFLESLKDVWRESL